MEGERGRDYTEEINSILLLRFSMTSTAEWSDKEVWTQTTAMLQANTWHKITRIIFASPCTSHCVYILCTNAKSRSPEGVFPFTYMHELIFSSASKGTYYIIAQQACHRLGSNKATGCVWPKPASNLPVADRNHNLSPPPTATVVQCRSVPPWSPHNSLYQSLPQPLLYQLHHSYLQILRPS